MADGTFAVLMIVAGLTDMNLNYCGTATGCLGKSEAPGEFAVSLGEVLERRAEPAGEVYYRFNLPVKDGPFQRIAGLSVGEEGETWIGFGQAWTYDFTRSVYTELHAMTGLYFDNGGFDLGGPIEFRSGIELGYRNRSGWRFGLSYDHRSNAGIYKENPGIETVAFRVTLPIR